MRDEFSKETKTRLAARAGNMCSFPGCCARTSGPSTESETATANTGMAAHISAASAGPGSKRYDSSLSSAERSGIENGIWCCYTHGKLIDTDDRLYSVEILKKWRHLAERRASLFQATTNRSFDLQELRKIGLAPVMVPIDNTEINRSIPKALRESCAQVIFGDEINSYVREFLIEHSKNAYEHGRATALQISFNGQAIEVRDNGSHFDTRHLLKADPSRGGAHSFQLLLKKLRVDASHSVTDGEWTNCLRIPIAFTVEELKSSSKCVVSLDFNDRINPSIHAERIESCQRIFVVFDGHLVVSDIPNVNGLIRHLRIDGKELIIVLPDATPETIARYKERCGVEVISLPVS